jgi:uncharacterized protein YbjT (DUF2867 family)
MASNESETRGRRILLTGATGFIGRHVLPALVRAGYDVRCASRAPARAAAVQGEGQWVEMDVEDPRSVASALQGCDAALYLVHQMHSGKDYPERESLCAEIFRDAAAREGLHRVVYLGGVAPAGGASRHLASRMRTGEVLRSGGVSVVELRAAMIVGRGSASWTMVRDLSARLPAMVLPRWLHNHSWPVAIDDIVAALLAALHLPESPVGFYDAPGPERFTHREILDCTARLIRGREPVSVDVPVLTPRLSSYWLALVTGVDLGMARELVEGLRFDLDPIGPIVWNAIPGHAPMEIETAIRHALADERSAGVPSRAMRVRLELLGAEDAKRWVR